MVNVAWLYGPHVGEGVVCSGSHCSVDSVGLSYLNLLVISGGGSTGGESVTIDPAELARMQQSKRKLRKMNDGGKLDVVHVSSDFNTMMLRPRGQTESKNKKGRRLRIDDILECEGGRLDDSSKIAAVGCTATTVSRLNTAHGA